MRFEPFKTITKYGRGYYVWKNELLAGIIVCFSDNENWTFEPNGRHKKILDRNDKKEIKKFIEDLKNES